MNRDSIIWATGALAVVLIVLGALWFTAPTENNLPDIYEVM